MKELRPYQLDVLGQMYPLIEQREHFITTMPTGSGKTRIAADIFMRVREAGKRCLFIVPMIEIVDQAVQAFYEEGIRGIGVIQADHHMTDAAQPVQVASVCSLLRRPPPMIDIVIVDEVHRFFKFYEKSLHGAWSHLPVIGLSATPGTKGLGKHFSKLIVGQTTAGLIDLGYLSPFKAWAPASPDLRGVRTVAGDYHEGDLSVAMNKTALVADIVSTWKMRGKGRPTVVFCVDRKHADAVQKQFTDAGVSAAYMDCYTPKNERSVIRERFKRGEIEIVVNVMVLGIGVDWPWVSCIILARPTKSVMLYVQMVGRGLRICEGKDHLLILDHSNNHSTHGFITDCHFDRLNKGEKEERGRSKPMPKPCTSCGALKPVGVLKCPNCGFEPKPKCDVVYRDGELIEYTARHKALPPEGAAFFAEVRAFGEAHGFKPGWAAHKYKERAIRRMAAVVVESAADRTA